MRSIPESYQDLLQDEARAYAFLATVMPDGTPQVTPVWFSVDGDYLLINSAQGRVKDRNMRARPDVALTIIDLQRPRRYLQVRGKVEEVTTQGAVEHINALSHKYEGKDFSIPAGQQRVTYKIRPESLSGE